MQVPTGNRRGAGPLDLILNIAIGVMAIAAIGFAGRSAFIYLTGARTASSASFTVRDDWRTLAVAGRRIGPADAAVTITVFSDYQCPFCAELDSELEGIRAKHPTQVALVLRHLPLTGLHPFAFDAAVASECAANQSRFAQFHAGLFHSQSMIGTRPWADFAAEAGVADSAAFRACMQDSVSASRVRRDVALAKQLRLSRTPTVLLNERFYEHLTPTPVEIASAVDSMLQDANGKPKN